MEPKQVVQAFLDHAAAGRTEEAIALIADDCECWYTGAGSVSRDDLVNGMRILQGMAAGGTRFPITEMIQEGDRVAVEYVGHMPLTNGRTYANTYHSKLVVRDGKIIVFREYLNPLIVSAALAPE